MRQAMLHYRALFDELIDDRIGNDGGITASHSAGTGTPRVQERTAALDDNRDADFRKP
jgi:hypothetical protein